MVTITPLVSLWQLDKLHTHQQFSLGMKHKQMGAVERRRERCIIPDTAPQTWDWTRLARITLSFPETGIAVGPKPPQTLAYHCVSGTQN